MKSKSLIVTARWLLILLAFISPWKTTLAIQLPGPLVETEWLADHRGEVVVLDVRKDAASYLGHPGKHSEKPNLKLLVGHIPGAVSVPWKKIVVTAEEQGVKLKSMLPTPEAFTQLMQASGVNKNSAVVIVGRGSMAKDQAYATRLYFTLKYFGHDNVALLNGGMAKWAKDGRQLAYDTENPAKGDFAISEVRKHLLATTDDVENAIGKGDVQLVDCRTEDFYLGASYKRNFVSQKHKGHFPGAKSMPFVLVAENWAPAKLFSSEEISKLAALKGVDLKKPTITYCNTGVVASLTWYALHELEGNQQTQLYDGSMHAWSSMESEQRLASLEAVAEPETDHEERPTRIEGVESVTVSARPPRSLQSLVDQRWEELRQRREEYFDAVSGRHLFQPPWMTARDEALDDLRDRMREFHRQNRDLMAVQHDTYRRLYSPWSQAFHDWAKARHFAQQMEQLDREELLDELRFGHVYAPWGPVGY